jgi:hypothetical protein
LILDADRSAGERQEVCLEEARITHPRSWFHLEQPLDRRRKRSLAQLLQ